MNIEQIKTLISDAIEHRSGPSYKTMRAKYFLWINLLDAGKRVYCSWTTRYRPAEGQLIVHTVFRNLDEGFSIEEWTEVAKKFLKYLA